MPEGARIAWFHCFSGITGDTALASLIDAGADIDEVRALCDRLPVDGWELDADAVMRGGLAASLVSVREQASTIVRTGLHISALIEEARLPERIRRRAGAVFDALSDAQRKLHRRAPEQIHFHEVGSLRAIIRVVGACAALEVLDVDEIYASEVAHGQGMVRSARGMMPLPAPTTVELLRNAPTYGVELQAELTSPTGAALLTSLVSGWGPMPPMVVAASGFGAGAREIVDRPFVTQVVLGTRTADLGLGQPLTLLEANLDDATGETLAHAVSAVLDAGATEAWLTPIVMSKGRPAHTLSALVDSALAEQVSMVLVAETGSQAIRGQRLERWPVARRHDEVDVAGRRVEVQVSAGRVKVEHDDAARAARHIGIPVREVVSLAEEAWRRVERGELTEVAPLNPLGPVESDRYDSSDPTDGPHIA